MADPRTYFDYEADADKISNGFPIAFDYLEDEHVTVEVDGVQNTDIELTTGTPIKVKVLSGVTAGQIVRVRRISDPASDLVDFQNGSVLTESELDRAYLHNRYLAEESAEQNDISLRVQAGADDQFDALNKKIINVSDPTADQDAATKNYVDGVVGNVAVGALPDNSVTYGKIQEAVANNVLLGNDNGVNSDIQELSATEVRTILNVADGAEVNVQSDWNEADTNSDAFIQNKPTIPTQTDLVPTGTVSAFAGSAAPTGYLLCDGDEYSETTESSLFAVIGSTYNTGGETANHFRVPDLRGRVVAGLGDNLIDVFAIVNGDVTSSANVSLDGNVGTIEVGMAVSGEGIVGSVTVQTVTNQNNIVLSSAVTLADDVRLTFTRTDALGDTGGTKTHTITKAEMPSHRHGLDYSSGPTIDNLGGSEESYGIEYISSTVDAQTTLTGSDQAHNNVQPTIILNYIIKT